MQTFSYHTHTDFSDGVNSVSEMVEQASKIGLKQIGISDHLIVHKNITQSFKYKEVKKMSYTSFEGIADKFNKHAEEIRKAGKKYQIQTRVGYEVDYFTYNGWDEEFRNFLSQIDYDYLINGNHYFTSNNGEEIFDIWCFDSYKTLTPEPATVYLKRHFETMNQAVSSGLFYFLAHLDYAQATSDFHEENYLQEILNVVQNLQKTNTGCEISTKGLRKFGHFYPSNKILTKLIEKNIPLIVSDDAHEISQISFSFDQAEDQLLKLNCLSRLKPCL